MSTVSGKALAGRKVRRQRQIVAVGSVILLALVGYQLPKLLGGGSTSSSPAPVSTGASQSGSPLAAAPGKLPDTDRNAVQPGPDQLLSFGLFRSKDPFVQQLSVNPSSPSPSPSPASVTPSPPATTNPVATTTSSSVLTVTSPSTTPITPVTTSTTTTAGSTPATTTPAAPPTAPTSVAISTNGFCEIVALRGTLPANEDIFRVVWIAKDGKSVKISVVGGSYDSGQATATVTMEETLTLVNTADGTHYVLALKSKCDPEPQPRSALPTTSTTPTTSATSAPTTVTTPIVTDSLDTTTSSSG